MQAGQDINVGGRLSKTEYQYTLTSTDADELNHWAPIIEEHMAKLPQLQDVTSDQQIASPHVAIDIDRDTASRLGLSLSMIDQTLYDAFGQRQVGDHLHLEHTVQGGARSAARVHEGSDLAVAALRAGRRTAPRCR